MKTSPQPDNPIALVTGGSGGLGKALCHELDALGCHTAIHYNRGEQAARSTAAHMKNPSMTVQADLGDWEAVQNMCTQIENDLGPVNVVVNNAAIRKDSLMALQSPESWREVIETNLMGTFHTTRATIPHMLRSRWGRVINVVSPSGLIATPGQTAYSASKAGVIGLTKTLAAECGRRGVTVNALSPGFMLTAMTLDLPEHVTDEMKRRLPVPRFTTAEEVAQSVGFFIESAYMTGQVVSIDGGISIT